MEKNKAIQIGLLLVIISGILYWGINFLSGKNVFTKTNTYYAYYNRIDGLQPNSNILLRGHKVGQVQDIYFTDSKYEQITVELSISKEILLQKNTIARIFSSDLMGTKSIDLVIKHTEEDSLRNSILQDGATLTSETEESLTDQVRIQMMPIKKQAEKLLLTASTAIDQMKYVINENTGVQLKTSFEKVQLTLDALHNSSQRIDTLLASDKIKGILHHVESITHNVSNKGEEIESIIANFSTLSDSLAKANIAETIANTDSVMTELSIILDKVNKGEGTLGALLQNDELYNNLEASSINLDKLLLDVKENPKRYVSFPIFGGGKSK